MDFKILDEENNENVHLALSVSEFQLVREIYLKYMNYPQCEVTLFTAYWNAKFLQCEA